MSLFERGGRHTTIPTVAQEVFDVAGAGDTVIATFTLALASGASMEQAARMANAAAGIVVGKLGVATASPEELLVRLGFGSPVVSRRRGRRRPLSARK
jgi:D-beta-D-heptose 7-phosphate kinase/D-beta-D-heptose 1-phosphate adenosyltransferase